MTLSGEAIDRQRFDALAEANRRRTMRAHFRSKLGGLPREESRYALAVFISRSPVWLRGTPVGRVICYARGTGDVYARKALAKAHAGPATLVGDLTPTQRARLCTYLRGETPGDAL